jgi:tetratricopeptide (TPR) repeat protein
MIRLNRRRARHLAASLLLLAVAVTRGAAQAADSLPEEPRETGKRAQAQFENFRRANLPFHHSTVSREAAEQVGRFAYYYDETAPPPPPEPETVTAARLRLIGQLETLAAMQPADNWIAGQRVRYLNEAGLDSAALEVARQCKSFGWWCDALQGFALHALRRYDDAERAYDRVLAQMAPSELCLWRDISLYLDEDTRKVYTRNGCGVPGRAAFEDRTWWYARTRYGMAGNDSRTEHFARLTYVEFLRQAPSQFQFGFDEDERELTLRFSWPRAWTRGPDIIPPMGTYGEPIPQITGHDPIPAHRFIPPYHVLTTPTVSDSLDWAVQRAPVVARYHPPYAKRLLMLEHQQALFRRGDTALVVLAYDVSKVDSLDGSTFDAALVLTAGRGALTSHAAAQRNAPARGTLVARAPWGPLLMSAEIAADAKSTLVRARYGIRPPYAIGARVALSDLLFFSSYGSIPNSVEEVVPHAIPTQLVRSSEKLGVFWEAYGTNPAGEQLVITLVVAPEEEEPRGALSRGARRMGIGRSPQSVRVSIPISSTRGSSTTTRGVELDISTLRRGSYLVNLEIEVAGQYTVRAERRLVVTGP